MPIEWDDMKGFLRFLEEKTISTNFGCLVGHGTLRCAVKGYSPEILTSKEMGKLKELGWLARNRYGMLMETKWIGGRNKRGICFVPQRWEESESGLLAVTRG